MRVKTFYRMLRYISAIVLFFFLWTFGPVWQAVAFAATPQKTAIKRPGVSGKRIAETRTATSAEKFEKALDDVRQKITSAEDKVNRGVEPTTELAAIKTKLAEIESLDTELKAEFAATKKKLIDAHLPKEILDRHQKFVKHYKDNMRELVANLTAVEQGAKHKGTLEKALEKAKEHLDRVKAPDHHQKLDPNNLPFRNRKVRKAKAPRLRRKDFEKDFPQQKSLRTAENLKSNTYLSQSTQRLQRTAELQRFYNLAFRNPHSVFKRKPILVASNGPLTGLLSDSKSEIPDLPFPEPFVGSIANEGIQNHESLSAMSTGQSPTLLAQATDLPSADDLAETPDIQFTDAIRAQAQALDHNPVKIYNWVRNNIEYAPTYGSIQGADQCLQSKICNDMDTASLLIALLRTSGIYAHYVYGTIQIPIDKAMNWVGGVTDPKMVGTIFATDGIPAKMLVSGGTYKAVQLEHVWASAFIDYVPSRGAVNNQGDTWIPLDPSFKQYTYTKGIDIASAVPFDSQTFANQLLSTATTNTTDGSVTNVNSAYIQQTMTDYQTQVQNYIQQNYPNATVGDVIGTKTINQRNYPILAGTLPYQTVTVGSEFSTIPDNLRETISFSIPDPTGATTGLIYATGMPQIAGKKITLSFLPATANDEAVIESLLPQPNPDGTPIDPSQLPTSLPAYLINLKPELRIDGQVVAKGTTTMMGSDQAFTILLDEPGIGTSNINNVEKAGEYFGIGVDAGRIVANQLSELKAKLSTTKTKVESGTYEGLTKDDITGDILYTTIASYFAELDASDDIAAHTTHIIRYRVPSVGMFSIALNIQNAFGVPVSAGPEGMVMDVDRLMQAVFSKDGNSNMDKVQQYMLSSGASSSLLESKIPEQLFSTPTNPVKGVSSVTALAAANDQGIPIYTIDQANINTISPLLQISADVKTDIQNAVNAGKVVTVSQSNVTVNGWSGCGYVIIDPITGAGAYMISGDLHGSHFMYYFWTVMWILAWVALIIAIGILALFAPEIVVILGSISSEVAALGVALSALFLKVSTLLTSQAWFRAGISAIMTMWNSTPFSLLFPRNLWLAIVRVVQFVAFTIMNIYKGLVIYIQPIINRRFALSSNNLMEARC